MSQDCSAVLPELPGAGSSPRRVLYEVATLLQSPWRRPTGIVRVLIAVYEGMRDADEWSLELCQHSARGDRYLPTERAAVEDKIASFASLETERDLLLGWNRRQRVINRLGRGPLGGAVRAALAARRRFLPRLRLAGGFQPVGVPRGAGPVRFDATTTYLSLGTEWLGADLTALLAERQRNGCRIVLACYDMVPLVMPETMATTDSNPWVARFAQVVQADVVLAISQATIDDIRRVAAVHQIPVRAQLRLMPIASGLDVARGAAVPPSDPPRPGSFVLTVGTLSPRKNFELLLDVWEAMVAERGADAVPTLVIAGSRGWLDEALVARLEQHPAAVRWIADPHDDELRWLYRNCCFSAMPSLYEGWGFPIAESLEAGKLCLCADTSSLPEVAAGLCPLLDPHDRRVWVDEVVRLWTDDAERVRAEAQIRAEYRPITSPDMVAAALAALRA